MKRRKRITITLLCLIVSVALGIFSIKLGAVSPTDKDYSPQSNTNSSSYNQKTYNHNPDSLKHNQQSRTFYNIQTKRKTPLIELNTADTLDLQALVGVGPAYARWIFNYRNSLGGFVRIEQLKEVPKMTVELYEKLLPQIILDASQIQKININTATYQELYRHPYIDYFIAKAIIRYRTTEGQFQTLDDLKAIYLIDDSTFRKLKPYLVCTKED
ncbi:MAG: helix-hairpin-helix domain-containing protein [Bacteroidales bacterium]|jgi:competence ComEA-like helix-hairpin-helix protein|nr:helix-hairpin-helix domain-containing protein [Bacteroidales bacterium]